MSTTHPHPTPLTSGRPRTPEQVDVLVVGAGPTGLTAAGDLAALGRRVVVLDRRPEPGRASRAFATMPRTLEVLADRGLADDLVAEGSPTRSVRLLGRGRLEFDVLDTPFPFVLIAPQTVVDAALLRYAETQGARVERGVEVVGLTQDADGVTVTTRDADGTTGTRRASYVVAADGAHSTVRDLLGVPFPGPTVLSSVVLADVRLTDPPTADGGLTVGTTTQVFGFLAPYGDGWFRSMTWDRRDQRPESDPVDEDRVGEVLHEALGRDVGVAEVGWRSRFHSDERQVGAYRHGRVLLAGDAAHVHSPVGGQGMNTGIQDAVNLAWKLDAVLAGAPDPVLDSYQDERHPVGAAVLRRSGGMLRALLLHPQPLPLLRDLLVALAVRVPGVPARIAGGVAGTSLRYDAPPRQGGRPAAHPLVGTRAATVPLEGSDPLPAPAFRLVRGRDDAPVDGVGLAQTRRTDDGPALLVRPDGYVAWAGDRRDPAADGPAGWAAAYAGWTGRSPYGVPRAGEGEPGADLRRAGDPPGRRPFLGSDQTGATGRPARPGGAPCWRPAA
ncbi:FAD-dependent oxidoreductase [Lapillicoccus jejuensis]|uniref:2-polyprenyl-6-methoxyphenol hydroxylase-like FAD-dependent oxidoreductase n=1 Tax=Lapillicoccus jejuensis TaxID=402171 RepID=A0A542DYP5_9MICO|nr:FAD-dependent oxidoreductase [Lapillicoccus jejuensis]TQJ08198.1 2-polyprenyl-6-methoxyphenol hydroxylase-like FAD-dependent oxidoreductase [Lapillicoccus jejuensis]